MIDPAIHGALVVLMTALINWLFTLLNINLGGDVINQLATLLVGYILSLLGLELYRRATSKVSFLGGEDRSYKPPFT